MFIFGALPTTTFGTILKHPMQLSHCVLITIFKTYMLTLTDRVSVPPFGQRQVSMWGD